MTPAGVSFAGQGVLVTDAASGMGLETARAPAPVRDSNSDER